MGYNGPIAYGIERVARGIPFLTTGMNESVECR